MESPELIETWRLLLKGSKRPWVLFENGTCVMLDAPGTDLALEAQKILREWGPMVPASEAGDFGVFKLKGRPGWMVTGHYPTMGTLVWPDEVSAIAHEVEVGLCGGSKRGMDAAGLRVLHVEPSARNCAGPSRHRWTAWRALIRRWVRGDGDRA